MLWLTGHWNDAWVVAVTVILLYTTSTCCPRAWGPASAHPTA